VKSLQGNEEQALTIGSEGVAGDRQRALVDESSGHLLSAKRVSALLGASGREGAIELPDGTELSWDADDVDDALSAWLGRSVRLAEPAADAALSYEMTFDPPNDEAEYYEIPAPVGSFRDLAPLHLITTATLDGCRERRPDLDWDVRRFRPNLLIDAAGEPFLEDEWVGRRLAIGDEVILEDIGPTVRCAMPLRSQPGLGREPGLFKAMSELHELYPNHLGAYAHVERPGTIRPGDQVTLLD
jgi:uncharacterized protein YcbX